MLHGIAFAVVSPQVTERGDPAHPHVDGLADVEGAVRAAISLSWSNGQVESHVNRFKVLKRRMYGRADFELLRRRVLGMAV